MSFSTMTVGDLRAQLEQYSDDALIILSGVDNNFSPVVHLSLGHYIAESDYSGDFVSEEDIVEDPDINVDGAAEAVVLWAAD